MNDFLTFLQDNWLFVSPLLLGLFARLIPTKGNFDFIGAIFKFLDTIVPNLRKTDNGKTVTEKELKKTKINNGLGFLLVLCLFHVSAFAQLNGNFKSVRFVNVTDSTTVLPINATIYYNEQSNKFRAYENGAWKDLIGAGGGSSFTLTDGSGTTADGTSVDLGGDIDTQVAINVPSGFNQFNLWSNGGYGNNYAGLSVANNFNSTVSLIADNAAQSQQIGITATGSASPTMVINDGRTVTTGITYASDYSGGFNARSLVDKAYVDSNIFSLSNGSGTTADGSGVNLGGSVNSPTDILIGSNTFNILTGTGFGARTAGIIADGSAETFSFGAVAADGSTAIDLSVDAASLNLYITDTKPVPLGARYGGDYTDTFIERSLIDKGYADNTLGGNDVSNLVMSPTITQNGYALTWDNTAGNYNLTSVGGGGITNTAANNEIPMSDGTNLVGGTGMTRVNEGIINFTGSGGNIMTIDCISPPTIFAAATNKLRLKSGGGDFLSGDRDGNDLELYAGNANGTSTGGIGGDIILNAGIANGSGDNKSGDVIINTSVGTGTGRQGLIIMDGLPTSDPSINGALWNDSGVLSVSGG